MAKAANLPTIYEVTLREGEMCRQVGLTVKPYGTVAQVFCDGWKEHDKFWTRRLAFLRANPNAA